MNAAFLISDIPSADDFNLSISDSTVLSFIMAQFIGKTFDGEGNLRNVLRNEEGFDLQSLAGVIGLESGFVDAKDSWVTRFPGTVYEFIEDEFREIKPGYLIGRTYVAPATLGKLPLFECGLVRVALDLPEGKTESDVVKEAIEDMSNTEEEEKTKGKDD